MSNVLFTEVSLNQQESVTGGGFIFDNKNRSNNRSKINIFNINLNINLIILLVIGNSNIIDISQFIKRK